MDFQKKYEQAAANTAKLQAEKDDALAKVYDKYGDRLRDAIDAEAAAQKAWMDDEAARALLDRPDGEAVAASLGLTLPE